MTVVLANSAASNSYNASSIVHSLNYFLLTDKADSLKTAEKRIEEINILKKHICTYKALRPIYDRYRQSKDKDNFEHEHRSEIILFEAAQKYMSSVQNGGRLPSLESLNTKLAELTKRKQQLYAEYKKSKKALSEMDVIKANVDTILNVPKQQKREQER